MSTFTIDRLLDNAGFNWRCRECQYYRTWIENHPYGETKAGEKLAECLCKSDNECERLQICL